MADAWELIQAGRYEEAIEACTRELAVRVDPFVYGRRSMAHLLAGHLAEARNDLLASAQFDRAPRMRHGLYSDHVLLMLGVIDWLAGDRPAAARQWHTAVSALEQSMVEYTDACGGGRAGSLLMFAAVHLSDHSLERLAVALFRKLSRRITIESWPGPIVEYYLGTRAEESLLASVSSTPILRERELCQATFAVAVSRLRAGDEAGYRASIARAAAIPAIQELESHLARYEAVVAPVPPAP
jgi:hypothetical protein